MSEALENVRRITVWSRSKGNLAAGATRIESVGIVGAGLMGASIAAAHVMHGFPVSIYDSNASTLAKATNVIGRHLGTSNDESLETVERLVVRASELADLARCDLLLEAIIEQLAAKTQLLTSIQPVLGAKTIVASNTSTIPMQRLAQSMDDPSRLCGLHFCHPVQKRPLVEIVRGPQTHDATIASLVAHVLRIDRIPIIVKDGPGFIVNRLLFPYLTAGLELLRDGVAMAEIEQAATDFGMAMGPLHLMDEIGLDTTLQAAWVLAAAFPDRVVSSPFLVALLKAKRLGQKSGAGFFTYDGPNGPLINESEDPVVAKLFARWREPKHPKPSVTAERLLLPMLLEATRILEEGMAEDPRDIDLAMLYGLGFPAEKGGLLWWADSLGTNAILRTLESFRYSDTPIDATPMLRRMAENQERFYPE